MNITNNQVPNANKFTAIESPETDNLLHQLRSKMIERARLILVVVLCVLLTGCVPAPAYRPPAQSVPLVERKGEGSVYLGLAQDGGEFQVANALDSSRILVFSVLAAYNDGCSTCYFNKRFLADVGYGRYFTEYGELSAYQFGVGGGTSDISQSFSFGGYPGFHEQGDFMRTFFQYQQGYRSTTKESVLSIRTSALYFLKVKRWKDEVETRRKAANWALTVEPAFTQRFRFVGLMFQGQIGGVFSVPIVKKFSHPYLFTSLGLYFPFSPDTHASKK